MRDGAMSTPNPPLSPSLPWRFSSSLIMGLTGSVSRSFLYALNKPEVIGLEKFMETLEKRRDIDGRQKGLITGTYYLVAERIVLLTDCHSIKPCQRVS